MSEQPVKPLYIALICAAAVAALFLGSIVISAAIIEAEHAQPAASAETQ